MRRTAPEVGASDGRHVGWFSSVASSVGASAGFFSFMVRSVGGRFIRPAGFFPLRPAPWQGMCLFGRGPAHVPGGLAFLYGWNSGFSVTGLGLRVWDFRFGVGV